MILKQIYHFYWKWIQYKHRKSMNNYWVAIDHKEIDLSDERKWEFFQAGATLVLLYICTTWT